MMNKMNMTFRMSKVFALGTMLSICLAAGPASAAPRGWFRFWGQQAPVTKVSTAPMEWTVGCPNGASIAESEARAMTNAVVSALTALASAPETRGTYEITLIGHADASGNDATNALLGFKRASSARMLMQEALVKHGAEGNAKTGMNFKGCRVVFRSYSAGSGSLADAANPYSATNRRVEVVLKKLTASRSAKVLTGTQDGAAPEALPEEPETWREFPQEVEKPIFDDGINY